MLLHVYEVHVHRLLRQFLQANRTVNKVEKVRQHSKFIHPDITCSCIHTNSYYKVLRNGTKINRNFSKKYLKLSILRTVPTEYIV